MLNNYTALIRQPVLPLMAGETLPIRITERHLQILWWEQSFFRPLISDSGKSITVLSQGLWNEGSGPDFRRAHLCIDGSMIRGDVEIHLRDEGWILHGHHSDSAYGDVILHVALWKGEKDIPILDQNRRPIEKLYLADQLELPLQKVLSFIDLELYPYRAQQGSGHCAEAIFGKMELHDVATFFETAALHRLSIKTAKIKALASTISEALKLALSRSLGLPENGLLFLRLAEWLKNNSKGKDKESLLAACMGISGFFEPRYQKLWNDSIHYNSLYERWQSEWNGTTTRFSITQRRVRPLHHPIRRFVWLISLISDSLMEELFHNLLSLWRNCWQDCSSDKMLRALWRKVRSLLPSYRDSYWETHYLFEGDLQSSRLSLLGDSIKDEMVVNTLLPLLYSEEVSKGSLHEQEAFLKFYRIVAATQHSQADFLKQRFFGDRPAQHILRKAIVEQGCLQLHNDFCKYFEVSCIGCPFIEHFQALSQTDGA